MSSDLNNGTGDGGPLFVNATPPKIDPLAPAPHSHSALSNQEEKKDMVKDEATAPASNSASASSGLGKSDHTSNNYFRDVYSSSPEEEDDLDLEAAEDTDKFIEINISEPHKVGEGMSSFMAYKVTTKTNLKLFKRENFSVTRRFSDFLGLHEKMVEKHGPRGRIIPPAPEKNLVGTTRVKISSNSTSFDGGNNLHHPNDELTTTHSHSVSNHSANLATTTDQHRSTEKEFISRRRVALERFVNRVAQHPVLRKDSMFLEFLESNRDLPRATSTSALSSASVFRLIGRMGDTVNKMTCKMEETDPWFEDKIVQLDALESQLKKLYTLTEALAFSRREMAIATGQFAASASILATTEDSSNLSRALGHLAKTEEKLEIIQHKQADADYLQLFELIKDYVALMGAVKDALTERQKAFQAWQHAQNMVLRKKEQKARHEMGGKMDKIPAANDEVQEWEVKLEESRVNFNRISDVIKTEIDFFERYRVKDFKMAIVQYMEDLMECQIQLAQTWEKFLPEVKNDSIVF